MKPPAVSVYDISCPPKQEKKNSEQQVLITTSLDYIYIEAFVLN